MSRTGRLIALERAAATARSVDESRQHRAAERESVLEARWAIMQGSMSEEHARLVVEAYAAGWQYVTSAGYRMPAANLLRRCLEALHRSDQHWPDSAIRPEVALAMPPEVAEVYLQHQHALPLHDCEACGYRVPHGFFEQCPLCGGRVGWNAYWHRHKDDSRTF